MKWIIKNPIFLVVLLVPFLLLGGYFLYLSQKPVFPESVPSPSSLEAIQDYGIQYQKNLYYGYVKFIKNQKEHVLNSHESEKLSWKSKDGKKTRIIQVFEIYLKKVKQEELVDLVKGFSQKQKIDPKIQLRKKAKSISEYDQYEVHFFKGDEKISLFRIGLEPIAEEGGTPLQGEVTKKELGISPQELLREDPELAKKLSLELATKLTLEGAVGQTSKREIDNESKEAYSQEELDPTPELEGETGNRSKLVIVIDDMGNDIRHAHKFLGLSEKVTFAVMPQLPHSRSTATLLHEANRQMILHLPMEPLGWPGVNPGPGALFMEEPLENIATIIQDDLETVPYVVGVSNHMGSAFTAYRNGMDHTMGYLKTRGLFFLDSKTVAGDLAKNAALNHDVPYLSRNIFLDNKQNERYVRLQLYKAVKLAKKFGSSIAIGHPYDVTYEVLEKHLPLLEKEGVSIQKLDTLLKK